jgi:hypothetical protein
VAGRWRSITRAIMREIRDPQALMDAIINTIMDILVVARCWDQHREDKGKTPFKKFHKCLERVVDGALKLQTAVGEEITGMDITPLTIRPGLPFDRERMENSYAADTVVDDDDSVLCTTELGLSKNTAARTWTLS